MKYIIDRYHLTSLLAAGEYNKEQIEKILSLLKPIEPLTYERIENIWKNYHRTLGGWDHGGTEVILEAQFEDVVRAVESEITGSQS